MAPRCGQVLHFEESRGSDPSNNGFRDGIAVTTFLTGMLKWGRSRDESGFQSRRKAPVCRGRVGWMTAEYKVGGNGEIQQKDETGKSSSTH
jgi:hypothetical protein